MKKLIGNITVDSGQIIVVDPCYLKDYKANDYVKKENTDFSYNNICHLTMQNKHQLKQGDWDFAIASNTGYGDGSYPVYAVKDKEGTVKKIIIEFIK